MECQPRLNLRRISMKRAVFIVLAVVLFTGIVLAGERWEIRPKYFDIDPNDGFMDPGNYLNPYIIEEK